MDLEAIDAMEKAGDVPGLIALINARDDAATGRVVRVLKRMADPRAVDALADLLSKSDYYRRHGSSLKTGTGSYQQDVIEALVAIGTPAVLKLLAEFEKNRSTRKHVAPILGRIGDPSAVDPLATYLSDDMKAAMDEPDVPFLVMEALATIGHPSCIPALESKFAETPLGSKLSFVLLDGLEKAGWIPGTDHLRVCTWIMKSEFENCVRMGDAAVEPLLRALPKAQASMQPGVVGALADIGDARAVGPLLELKNKVRSYSDVVAAIEAALAKLGAPDS